MSAILTIAARWRGGDGKPFTPELFGSFELFWEFLRLANVVEGVSGSQPLMYETRCIGRLISSLGACWNVQGVSSRETLEGKFL